MSSSREKNVSETTKKTVASRQKFRCANAPGSHIRGLEDYDCVMWKLYEGSFDESCYEIDHITERCIGGDNDIKNLQALCLCCHEYKTRTFKINRKKNNDMNVNLGKSNKSQSKSNKSQRKSNKSQSKSNKSQSKSNKSQSKSNKSQSKSNKSQSKSNNSEDESNDSEDKSNNSQSKSNKSQSKSNKSQGNTKKHAKKTTHKNSLHDEIMKAINSPWQSDFKTLEEQLDFFDKSVNRDKRNHPEWFSSKGKKIV